MAEVLELQKLKLAELRQECDVRGLETKGNKGELIARLHAYLEEHGEEEDVDVDDVLAEDAADFTKVETSDAVKVDNDSETVASEPPAEKKVVKISPPLSTGERLQMRAERFNMPASADSKKAMRAARFGLPSDASSPSPGVAANSKAAVNIDQLKKRAERFGMNVSTISQKYMNDQHFASPGQSLQLVARLSRKDFPLTDVQVEDDEKLKKRKERFGIQTGASSVGAEDVEAKKMKRAERFGKV